jgi:hypothetical protein
MIKAYLHGVTSPATSSPRYELEGAMCSQLVDVTAKVEMSSIPLFECRRRCQAVNAGLIDSATAPGSLKSVDIMNIQTTEHSRVDKIEVPKPTMTSSILDQSFL